MRIIHTSDWHLGRALYGLRLIEDQAYVLDRFVETLRDVRPDLVVIAGDVFDRAQPPRDSLQLLNDILNNIVVSLGIPVLAIAGNHDSAELIEFGAQISKKGDLFLSGVLGDPLARYTFHDKHGPVHFYTIPYADPAVVRERWGKIPDEVPDHDAAFELLTNAIRADCPKGERCVVVTHAFVAGGAESTSERPLSVGGAGNVRAGRFEDFTYTCLGHLHRPQSVEKATIRYSGSLLKYSASEVDHEKSMDLVEIRADGRVDVEPLPITPKRDFRILEGAFDDLLTGGLQGSREDFLLINLSDREPILDAMARLRTVYPNIVHITRTHSIDHNEGDIVLGDHRVISPVDLFEGFFKYVTGDNLDQEQRKVVSTAVADVNVENEEVE